MLGEDALNIKTLPNCRTNIIVEGFKVYKESLRYATFYQKGTKCVCCGREGTYFKLDIDRNGVNSETRRHFNLYSDDGVLMTKDHIRPKKLGGQDIIDNLQTMCEECNREKGSTYNTPIPCIVGTNKNNTNNKLQFVSIEDAVFSICERKKLFDSKRKPGKLSRRVIQETLKFIEVLDKNIVYYDYIWTTEFKIWEDSSNNE